MSSLRWPAARPGDRPAQPSTDGPASPAARRETAHPASPAAPRRGHGRSAARAPTRLRRARRPASEGRRRCRARRGRSARSESEDMATRRASAPSTSRAKAPGSAPTIAAGDDSLPTPIEPMLAKAVDALPSEGGYLYEPKWDGFRAIVFRPRAGAVAIQSRDLRPLDRYFPELHDALLALLPDGAIVDGEIVVASGKGLDFDALQQRLHPAASRVAKLSVATPASFVAFDLLAVGGTSLVEETQEA